MPVKINLVEDSETQGGLYTGVALLHVLGVNPSNEQLQKWDLPAQKSEPEYISEQEDKTVGSPTHGEYVPTLRLDFYLRTPSNEPSYPLITVKHTIWLKPVKRTMLYINNYAEFGKDPDVLYAAGEPQRNPYEGEIDLIVFLQTLVNQKKGEELYLERLEDLVHRYDLRELRDILRAASANKIKALLTVKDGKYQSLYPKKFQRSYTTTYQYLHRSLLANKDYFSEDYGPVSLSDYQLDDFLLRKYEPLPVVSSKQVNRQPVPAINLSDPARVRELNAGKSAVISRSNSFEDDDDLPF